MKSAISQYISLGLVALLIAGCSGSQDYAKPPQTDEGSITGYNPSTPTSTQPRVQTNSSGHPAGVLSSIEPEHGHLWKGLEWMGMKESTVNQIRCDYGDSAGIREFDALGYSLVGGAIVGVIVRASGSVFFGKPAVPHHHNGHHGHHAGHQTPKAQHNGNHEEHEEHHEPVVQRTLWQRVNSAGRSAFGSAFGGAVAVGICQTLLAGGNMSSFDGILGQDFAGLSAALAVGGASTMAVSPWVKRFFNAREADLEQDALEAEAAKQAEAEAKAEAEAQKVAETRAKEQRPDLPFDEPLESVKPPPEGPKTFGSRMRNLVNWPATGEFVRGTWYRFLPNITILGISGGVGVLVYHDLHNKAGYEVGNMPANCLPVE